MQSSLIGKVQKANRYAQEPERINIAELKLQFRGENGDHTVRFASGKWHCSCDFFAGWQFCCHTMALERVLGVMVTVEPDPTRDLQEGLAAAEALASPVA